MLGKPMNLRVTVITGGMDMVQQGSDLSIQPHIVISTPGRLADHMQSCDTFSLDRIKFLVLDEADRLLEDDFGEQLATIFDRLPDKRQTLLFSATKTDTLMQLQSLSNSTPYFWQQQSETLTVEQLDQRYVFIPADLKEGYLVHILDKYLSENPRSSVIIFTSTCKYAQVLSMVFSELGFPNVVLHSIMKQRLRLAALAKFKSSQIRILIATDVASRGLDIPMVDLILNHNVPNRAKDYVHRVGRTARAGRGGKSITLITPFDLKCVKAIESLTKIKMQEHPVSEAEVLKILAEVAVAKSEAEIRLDQQDFGEKRDINKLKKKMLEGSEGATTSIPDEKLTEEQPVKTPRKHKSQSTSGSVKRKKRKVDEIHSS